MATHSGILAWEIPWTEEPGMLQSIGSQRIGHNLVTEQQQAAYLADLLEIKAFHINLICQQKQNMCLKTFSQVTDSFPIFQLKF